MERYIVEQSPPLRGNVKVSGSKNSVLPILAATILTEASCTIRDVPALSDVCAMSDILKSLGMNIDWDLKKRSITTSGSQITDREVNYELAQKMRASFLVMGPLLARNKRAKIPLPGGCAIGSRPVDLHLKGFLSLGAEISNEGGFVVAKAQSLRGNKIYLDFPSVGATENIIMAAVLAEGQTIIENSAVEPEIVDLVNFLNSAGAEIRGAGTDTIKINGVQELCGTDHTIIPDRIEAGTFMIAAALTNGDVTINNVLVDHLKPIIAKLKETGTTVTVCNNSIKISATENKLVSVDVKTLPYPGFPTDMQAQFMSLLSLCQGTGVVTETVFENRFMHVGELGRMGANVKIDSRSAVVEGVARLSGSQVRATDLRAGAALVLAGLRAEGRTEVFDIYHIERGYVAFEEKLKNLGARIWRISE